MFSRWSCIHWYGIKHSYLLMPSRIISTPPIAYSTFPTTIQIAKVNRTTAVWKGRKLIPLFSKHRGFNIPPASFCIRHSSSKRILLVKKSNNTTLMYWLSGCVALFGLSYAAVPLYRIYCQATGYGGTTQKVEDSDVIKDMERVHDRPLTIRFESGTGRMLNWKFTPQQSEVKLVPGETALAFFTAENLSDEPIIGIATYNVLPYEAGQYFNKIQCFCFEEQRLNPHEEVDMPVFFYIDPEIDNDLNMSKHDDIVLHYTFFESNGQDLPPELVAKPH